MEKHKEPEVYTCKDCGKRRKFEAIQWHFVDEDVYCAKCYRHRFEAVGSRSRAKVAE